jgi:hypothetical protein
MLIVGLEHCAPCKEFRAKHPNIRYIEVPRQAREDIQARNMKKRLTQLGVTEFPVILNDGMTKVLPLSSLDSN